VLIPDVSIAIWNHKKAVVRIAICLWVTNIAFFLQGKSLPLLHAIPRQRIWAGIIRVNVYIWVILHSGLIPSQVRFVWLPEQRACASSNVDGIRLALIVTLITDIILLVIVLVGLFRMRPSGGGSFGLQGVLWKQVRWTAIPSIVVLSPHPCVSVLRVLFGSCLLPLPRSRQWYVV